MPRCEDIVGGLQASGARIGRVGLRLGVAEGEGGDTAAKPAPELEYQVASNGNADQRCATDVGVVHDAHDVSGVLLHRGGPFPYVGIAVCPEVGQDHAITRGQRFCDRQPEFMICRKRMQKHNGIPVTGYPVMDSSVSALDLTGVAQLHAKRLKHSTGQASCQVGICTAR